jgi:putative ABC transport system ATP-binding protein
MQDASFFKFPASGVILALYPYRRMSSASPIISMSNVSHSYGSGSLSKQVLFDVTCDISPGEIVIITGPSGSGKTTVLTLAGALRSVQHGSMQVLGQELKGARQSTLVRIRESIGFIFQTHNLLDSLTALQNVQMSIGLHDVPAREARDRSAAMLEAVGLGDRLHYLPEQLSGGQRQRVAVARAIVRRPKIILADEPTASLDKQSGRDVVALLRQLARREGCAVLMVTHDNRVLDIADRLMRLEDGRLSSFDSVLSPYAGHLLTIVGSLQEKDHVRLLMDREGEGEFLEFLKMMGGEVEQLLNVLNLGGTDSLRKLLNNILDVVLSKIAEFIGATGAGLFNSEGDAIRIAIEPSSWPAKVHAVGAAESGRIVNASTVLCVPLRNRQDDVIAVAQLVNKNNGAAFSDADERAFRDFSSPLGLIVECWRRVTDVGAL